MTKEEVYSICEKIAAEYAGELFEKKDWPENTLRALQAAGLGGLVVGKPEKGLGLGLEALAKSCEILGKKNPSAALCFGMHHVGAAVINAKATSKHKEEFLIPISEGKHITSLALSEPGTGVHFYYPQTQLLAVNHHLVLNGKKSFVTNGFYGDSYVVSTMPADPEAPPETFSCVVLPQGTEGMSWSGEWTGMGMRQNSARSLNIDGVRIPRENLLGEMGDHLWYVFHIIAPYFLTAMAGTYLGIAQTAMEEACNNLKRRTYAFSGASLGHSAILQHRLGSMYAEVEASRQLLSYAAREMDAGNNHALPALLSAKAQIAGTVERTMDQAMVILGGRGYEQNSFMEHLLLDSRAAHIMAPTTDLLFTWTGRALLELPILAE